MALSLRIALRYLLARKSHSAVNIISMVSMAGIALAVTALVVVMSVFNGFHSLIESRLSALDPPLAVKPAEGKSFSSSDSLCNAIEALPSVAQAFPIIEERALAVVSTRQMAIRLRGIPDEFYPTFTDSICPAGTPWADYHPAASPAVLSVGVANELQVPIGSEQLVNIYVPRRKGRINPANPATAFRTDSVAPSAVFMLNQPEVDRDVVYAPITLVSRLLQLDNKATSINVYPTASVNEAKRDITDMLGRQAHVLSIFEQQSGSFQIVNMEKWMTFMLLGFILAIASFNIISSLSLLIIEKEPNAEMLAALGATPNSIRNIYRIEGLLITCIGTIAGIFAGTLLSLGQEHFGWVKLAGEASQLSVTAYPVVFHAADLIPVILLSATIGLATSLLATLPSNKRA